MATSVVSKGSKPLIVVVLGATGAGKSKLALDLALKFGGEIISADAVQMYKGLDIVTNKVSHEERAQVKHHLIDFLDPLAKCTVVDFRNKALPIIDDMLARNVTPFICGGTNYYVESLLWKILVEDYSKSTEERIDGTPQRSKRPKLADDNSSSSFDDSMTNQELYERLVRVDPERAQELHHNERRKVMRSLEVFSTFGKAHSQILKEQRSEMGGGLLGGPLRFPKEQLAVLLVQCDQEVLDQRCDERVDKMIQQGLLDELKSFHQEYNQSRLDGKDCKYTEGIFQSIGFKEFHKFLVDSGEDLPDADTDSKEEQKRRQLLYDQGVDQMKLATRQYARRQVKWVQQRFLNPRRDSPPVYAVNSAAYPDRWQEDVLGPASDLLESMMAQRLGGGSGSAVPAAAPLLRPLERHSGKTYSHEDSRRVFNCPLCGIEVKGRIQLEAHINSRKHRGRNKHLDSGATNLRPSESQNPAQSNLA